VFQIACFVSLDLGVSILMIIIDKPLGCLSGVIVSESIGCCPLDLMPSCSFIHVS
jgi:hypothetical protein